jgi:plasmid replication initiation protein
MKTNDNTGLVVKSNALINAMVDLSLQANRFLAFAISLLDRGASVTPGEPIELEIPVAEFATTFNIPKTYVYKEIESLADQLQRKIITLQPDQTTTGRRVKLGLITTQEYMDSQGRVWLTFHKDIVPHVLGLREQFTRYRIKDVYQFTSVHTWRIYEALKQYERIGKREVDLDELKRLTNTVGKYPRPTDFKRFVIDTAVDEINSKSDIMTEYEQKKRGRRITGFLFIIRDNQQTKTPREKVRELANRLDTDSAPGELERTLVDEYRVSQKQARQLSKLATGNEKKVLAKLPRIRARYDKLKEKKTSLGGYVFRAIKDELSTNKQGGLPI